MPEFTVPIDGPNGPGFMTVNASDAAAAVDNASQGGNYATGGAVSGGHQAHTGEGGTAVPGGLTPSNTGQQQNTGAGQYADAIQRALDALASGNREAFARAIYEFDVAFQLDKDKFAEDIRRFNQTFGITEAGLTGMYQGAPTLPALTSYANQFGQWGVPTTGQQTLNAQLQNATLYGANALPTPGQATLAAQQQAYAQQMGMINQAASLQANPFRQQQVIGQMGNLLRGGGVAGFSAPNTVAGVGTAGGNTRGGMGYLQQMIDDIRDPTANTTSMNSVLDATPNPNKLNSVEFLRAAPSSQSMVLQAMQEKYGLDPGDALKQIQNTLPQFQAPTTMGTLRR